MGRIGVIGGNWTLHLLFHRQMCRNHYTTNTIGMIQITLHHSTMTWFHWISLLHSCPGEFHQFHHPSVTPRGFEPLLSCSTDRRFNQTKLWGAMFHCTPSFLGMSTCEILLESTWDSEHQKGFEPSPSDWKSDVLTIDTTGALCGKWTSLVV